MRLHYVGNSFFILFFLIKHKFPLTSCIPLRGPLHLFTLMKDFTKWLDMLPNDLWIYYAVHWLAMVCMQIFV